MTEDLRPAMRGRRWWVAAAVIAASLAFASCSSAESTTKPGSSTSISASDDPAVKAAKEFIEPYLEAPTTIPLTEPLASPPAKGKSIIFLQCELAQCKGIGSGVEAAAKVVEWDFKTITYQSTDPSTLAAALDQALTFKPAAVAFTSPPFALWSQKVAEYKAAGIPLIPSFTGEVPIDDTVIANPASKEYAELNGQILGNWFIADSGAKGHALSVSVNDFPYLASTTEGFDSTVDGCATCKLTKLNVGIPDVANGNISNIIVSAIRKDPSIDYVVPVNAVFASALPSALGAAGLAGKVKVAGCCGDTTTEAGLATGDFAAITGVNGGYAGFITLDAAIRADQGLPIPENEGMLPVGLLLPGTEIEPADSYNQPVDFVEQLMKLWMIG